MNIKEMFRDDIQRVINGVVQVGDKEEATLYQQLTEYVVTRELRTHFVNFFNNYARTGHDKLDRIGVWISGFFGSGKSHFLKMLSYLLSNQPVRGEYPLEIFREKLELDAQTMADIERCCGGNTRTLLFNIGTESPDNRDKGVIIRIFAKLFYNMLGYCGNNLAVVELEKALDRKGKLAEFAAECERQTGESWEECRKSVLMEDEGVAAALVKTMGMSEAAAMQQVHNAGGMGKKAELSVRELVDDICAWLEKQPADFRLLFMADEVGQYIGNDRQMLLDLQSLLEELGSRCAGRVWVVCTGQEALDEVILKVRTDEFSRIQARFYSRLSLSSTSVEEVICKRLLTKTPPAAKRLSEVYAANAAVLRNLFAFKETRADVRGFADEAQFISVYPFIPYQFRTLQRVFSEIRKHGNAGMHLAHGERSMLSGFQDTACALIGQDELALAPFYCFYDTVQTFLGSDIRLVIDRAERAADENEGLLAEDVPLLKLLFLIRYIDDIPSTLDNLVILMADRIDVDPIALRARIKDSLARLHRENYISLMAGRYTFLTDEEQDIAKEINATAVEPAAIIQSIGSELFSNIYRKPRYRRGTRDFTLVTKVDNLYTGSSTGDLPLTVFTQAMDWDAFTPIALQGDSRGRAIICLKSGNYFDYVERAQKIRKFVRQRNPSEMHQSVREIIEARQREAAELEESARTELAKSIQAAECYIHEELVRVPACSSAAARLDAVLEELFVRLFDKHGEMETHFSEEEVRAFINAREPQWLPGQEGEQPLLPNLRAQERILTFLATQQRSFSSTSFADVRERFRKAPYGWSESDMAYTVALLIRQQKVDAMHAGTTLSSQNARLADLLLNTRQAEQLTLKLHVSLPDREMRALRALMQDYAHGAPMPSGSEEEIFAYVDEQLRLSHEAFRQALATYDAHPWYPGRQPVQEGAALLRDILSLANDHRAMLTKMLDNADTMLDCQDALTNSCYFFTNQSTLFNQCRELVLLIDGDYGCLDASPEGQQVLEEMKAILATGDGSVFSRVPQLNKKKATLQAIHDELLTQKKNEVLAAIEESCAELRALAAEDDSRASLLPEAEQRLHAFRQDAQSATQLSQLSTMCGRIYTSRDAYACRMQEERAPQRLGGMPVTEEDIPLPPPCRKLSFNSLFRTAVLSSEQDVEHYLSELRVRLLKEVKSGEPVQIER